MDETRAPKQSERRTSVAAATNGNIGWIANYIWGIADDVLRDLTCGASTGTSSSR